jgi:hypothetical protein
MDTTYKIGQTVRIKVIPGFVTDDLKVQFPVEAKIVGIGNEAVTNQKDMVLVECPSDWFKSTSKFKGWSILDGDPSKESFKEYISIDGDIIDKNVVYITPDCFELVESKGKRSPKFNIDQHIKYEDETVRVLGYNLDKQTYLVETAKEGTPLTHTMIKGMDVFLARDCPDKKGVTNIKVKILSEKDLLKVKENKVMSNSDKPGIVAVIKDDAQEAAYRVAVRQMSKAVRTALVKMMQARGAKRTQLKALEEFFATELGEIFIKNALGYALTYIPGIKDDPRAQRMAKEFRVDGIADAGNLAMEHFLPVLLNAFNTLPALPEMEEAPVKEVRKPKVKASMEDLEQVEVVEMQSKPAAAMA